MPQNKALNIDWFWSAFDNLTNLQLEAMLRLRQQVFIVEQNCPYLDADGKDQYAFHLLGYLKDELIATLRYFPRYKDYNNLASLGRVCTTKKLRNYGVGQELMKQAIYYSEQNYPEQAIQIGAQSYLEKFYCGFGFERISEEYLEDDIPHILMRREAFK